MSAWRSVLFRAQSGRPAVMAVAMVMHVMENRNHSDQPI
jgi:hypothetical protein